MRMKIRWIDGASLRVLSENGTATICANREGLLSLARQLTDLAEETPGSHIHYDDTNSLEDGSDQLIVELVEPDRRR